MNVLEVAAVIRADLAALGHIAGLIVELHHRLLSMSPDDTLDEADLRVRLALDRWQQLDELGVDLNLPELKTLVAAHAASHPTSSGAVNADSPSSGAFPAPDAPATPLPAPLDHDREEPA